MSLRRPRECIDRRALLAPGRQEIEIRRTGSWLDYPARGIIPRRWEICCYEVNTGIPTSFFVGPEIVIAPPRIGRRGHSPSPGCGSIHCLPM